MKKEQIIILQSEISKKNPQITLEINEFLTELDYKNISFAGNVFIVGSGGVENDFKNKYQNYKEPYFIISYDKNNSLPACLEIISFLKMHNKECYLLSGGAPLVKEKLSYLMKNNICISYPLKDDKELLRNEKIAYIGDVSSWLIASHIEDEVITNKFGAEIIHIDYDEFIEAINNVKKVDNTRFKEKKNKIISLTEINKALKIYYALKDLIKKHNITALTIKCFDLLDIKHTTSCLALALLNEEGITSSCEGDMPSLISMLLLKKIVNKPSFQVNPSYINEEKNYGYFAHCTLPLNMAKQYSFDTHFESGIGIGIKGELKNSSVTILKVNNDLSRFVCYEGKIICSLNETNLCRSQVKILLDDPIENILTSPFGNHLLIIYGKEKSSLISRLSSSNLHN